MEEGVILRFYILHGDVVLLKTVGDNYLASIEAWSNRTILEDAEAFEEFLTHCNDNTPNFLGGRALELGNVYGLVNSYNSIAKDKVKFLIQTGFSNMRKVNMPEKNEPLMKEILELPTQSWAAAQETLPPPPSPRHPFSA